MLFEFIFRTSLLVRCVRFRPSLMTFYGRCQLVLHLADESLFNAFSMVFMASVLLP